MMCWVNKQINCINQCLPRQTFKWLWFWGSLLFVLFLYHWIASQSTYIHSNQLCNQVCCLFQGCSHRMCSWTIFNCLPMHTWPLGHIIMFFSVYWFHVFQMLCQVKISSALKNLSWDYCNSFLSCWLLYILVVLHASIALIVGKFIVTKCTNGEGVIN